MRSLFFLAIFLCCFSITASGAPKVVVTLKPIHSLVSAVMAGVGEPQLLLPDGASPHTFQLKPSTLKALTDADIIIWVGPELEVFMSKPLTQLASKQKLITLLEIPEITKLPQRKGRAWQENASEHHHEHHGIDPHIWLSIKNASVIVDTIAKDLAKADPEHAAQYQQNAKNYYPRLNQLHAQLEKILEPVKNKPFLVYHDGYQYFEKDYGLHAAGAMVINMNVPLSANAINAIQKLIREKNIHCVFRETEFSDRTIERSLGQIGIKVAELDPLGARIPKGPENYEQTLLGLGNTVKQCLTQPII